MDQREIERIRYELQYGKPHGVQVDCTVNVLLEEMRDWKPETMRAFMGGIASVIAVQKRAGEDRSEAWLMSAPAI